MKNLFKPVISWFICGLILLSGCGVTPNSLPSELKAPNTNYPKSVSILAPDFFTATGAANADQAKQQWLDVMSERYGVRFDIIAKYTPPVNYSSSGNRQNGQEFVGLTAIDSTYELKSGIKNGTYMPLEGYLADNPVWKSLPADFKSLFEVDGHIYAIPASIFKAQKARIIHDEALAETGITVTDLDSFYDFAVAYAKKAGRGTGRGRMTGSYMMPDAMDIMNAFGLYPGTDQKTQFSYDPTADCYVDWLTKDTAVKALEYMRELVNISALSPADTNEAAKAFDNGLFATEYAPYFDYENCAELVTLNSEYPQVLSAEITGYAMTQGTPQPQETCNLLIDMLFGSEQSYLECWLGSSDNYVLNSDGTITIKMAEDSEGNFVPPCVPNLTGGLSELFPYSSENLLYDHEVEKDKARLKMFSDSLQNGSLVEIPPEYQMIKSAAYDAGLTGTETDVGFFYFSCFARAILMNDKTVQQIVDQYKQDMLKLGGNQMLDEMNAAIGKKTAYYYG